MSAKTVHVVLRILIRLGIYIYFNIDGSMFMVAHASSETHNMEEIKNYVAYLKRGEPRNIDVNTPCAGYSRMPQIPDGGGPYRFITRPKIYPDFCRPNQWQGVANTPP